MGIVPKETIEVIAQSIGITNLAPDVAVSFAPDVEYWVREIMQEAIKCMHPSRRTVLTTGDIDSALNLRNVENLCVSIELQDTKTNIILMKKDMEFGEEIEAPLPESPLDSTVLSHWKECSRQSQKMLQLKHLQQLLITKGLSIRKMDFLLTLNHLSSLSCLRSVSFTLTKSRDWL